VAAAEGTAVHPQRPLPQLGSPGRNVTLLVMGDGTVRLVRKNFDERVPRALITANGGEALPEDWDK
jgi:hypothetical protein